MSFSFHRENIEVLIKDLNQQKSCIKKNGIVVDGRHFKVKFTGNNYIGIVWLHSLTLPLCYYFVLFVFSHVCKLIGSKSTIIKP